MAVRIHDPVEKPCNLVLNHLDLLFHVGAGCGLTAVALLPFLPQLRFQPFHTFRRRRDRLQQVNKAVIYLGPRDRLAPHLAATVTTDIIGIVVIPSLCPIRRHGMIAFAAVDKAAQREILIYIGADRRERFAVQAFLYALERLQRNQRLMLRFPEGNPPDFAFDIACVDRARQDAVRLLVGQEAMTTHRKTGMRLKEALDLSAGGKTPAGVAFQPFGDDRGNRLIAHQHAAASGALLVAIAKGSIMHPVAIHHPRPHPVFRLLTVFLALMLGDTRQQMLNQLAVRVRSELDGRAFKKAARAGNLGAQFQVGFNASGKT